MRVSRRGFLSCFTLGVAMSLLAGCGSRTDFNQKLTVTVSTPNGERQGFAVTNVETTVGRQFASGTEVVNRIRGEATVVEVVPGKYLFALLGEGTKNLAFMAWKDRIPARDTADKMKVIEGLREAIEISGPLMPLLVTFTNINDPASVVEVKPNELAQHFGAGVSLKSITLEITDEPVTEGVVERVLGWLATHKGRIRSPDLRLGKGLHAEADVLPVENIEKNNFVEEQK